MRETLTANPELFSDISWNLLLLGEETAKKWDHSEFNIEHVIHTLFSSSEFFAFIEKLSINQNIVLDITEEFLEETPINESDIFTIGEDLEILLDNANQIKIQWGSKLIEIPHLLIALCVYTTYTLRNSIRHGFDFNSLTLIDKMKNLMDNFTFTYDEGRLHFSVLDPEKDMATIIKILTKNDCHIQNINVDKASLEDVFLDLTGERIS